MRINKIGTFFKKTLILYQMLGVKGDVSLGTDRSRHFSTSLQNGERYKEMEDTPSAFHGEWLVWRIAVFGK